MLLPYRPNVQKFNINYNSYNELKFNNQKILQLKGDKCQHGRAEALNGDFEMTQDAFSCKNEFIYFPQLNLLEKIIKQIHLIRQGME